MNVSLICLSLKYLTNKVRSSKLYRYLLKPHKLKTSYRSVSKVSKWFYHELVKYNYNDNKLRKALDKKDYKIIKSIITFVQNKNILNEYLCIYCDNFDMIKLLINNGADVHENDDQLLVYSSGNYHFDVVKLLVDNGANIHAREDYPLRLASHDHYNMTKFFIENGADVHAHNDHAFKIAIVNNRFDIAQLLIENGVDIHVNNDELIKWMSRFGRYESVKLLIDNNTSEKLN